VNAGTLPAPQLACLLYDTAAGGTCADVAAVMLIDRHGHFLHDPAFRRIIAAGSAVTGQPAAVIRWSAAIWALEHGQLPCSPPQRAVLRIAASIADQDIPVRLGASLGTLDARNIALVTDAITAASS
jgi:hypothetical protein